MTARRTNQGQSRWLSYCCQLGFSGGAVVSHRSKATNPGRGLVAHAAPASKLEEAKSLFGSQVGHECLLERLGFA